jgi:hypothetical protein
VYIINTIHINIYYIIIYYVVYNKYNIHKKGKADPLQAWSGPEGSRKIRFPDFMTKAQDGGKFVRLRHRPPLPPGNTPGTHLFLLEADTINTIYVSYQYIVYNYIIY